MNILVVGDMGGSVPLIERAFKEHEAPSALRCASSAVEAYGMLMSECIDTVIVDSELPGVTGTEFVRRMKCDNVRVPVIMVSGDRNLTEQEVMDLGIDGYVRYGEGFYKLLPPLVYRSYIRYLLARLEDQEDFFSETSRKVLRSRQNFQVTVDAVSDYIFATDREGRIFMANAAFAASLGVHPRETIGWRIGSLPVAELAAPQGILSRAAEGEAPASDEVRVGEQIFSVRAFPAMFEEVEVFVFVMKDITEIKSLREQLYHSGKLASIGLHVSSVVHEINSPLTGILGYTDMLRSRGLDDKAQGMLDKVYRCAERCKQMVGELLHLSRSHSRDRMPSSVNEVVERALEVWSFWGRASDVAVQTHMGRLPAVLSNPRQLQQVVLNLLMNAGQALGGSEGKGRITIGTSFDEEREVVQISVSDNGGGIPGEHLGRIFEPFFTTKPPEKGTGLGLSICKSIVEEHGGTLRVRSEPGEGTTFVVELAAANGRKPIGSETRA